MLTRLTQLLRSDETRPSGSGQTLALFHRTPEGSEEQGVCSEAASVSLTPVGFQGTCCVQDCGSDLSPSHKQHARVNKCSLGPAALTLHKDSWPRPFLHRAALPTALPSELPRSALPGSLDFLCPSCQPGVESPSGGSKERAASSAPFLILPFIPFLRG